MGLGCTILQVVGIGDGNINRLNFCRAESIVETQKAKETAEGRALDY